MDNYKLIQMKKRLLALGLTGVMVVSAGCTNSKNHIGEPTRVAISQEYSNIEDYYKYIVHNDKVIKKYKSKNVYLLYDKETYKVKEYIYQNQVTVFGGVELYDLLSEEMLVYSDGVASTYNREFYKYLLENNYQVCLNEVSDYVEAHISKEYYSLIEIKELEPQIEKSLKLINNVKTKTK